jgi:hypothetical protein
MVVGRGEVSSVSSSSSNIINPSRIPVISLDDSDCEEVPSRRRRMDMEYDEVLGGRMAGGDGGRGEPTRVKVEGDEEVVDLVEDEELQVLGGPTVRKPARKPEFIDLTNDEDEEDDEEYEDYEGGDHGNDVAMASDVNQLLNESCDVMEIPQDDMPELIDVEPVSRKV